VTLYIQEYGIEIAFEDDGIGIAEADLPHIFDPFYRADSSQYVKGHGVGLALTQRIIKLHGGDITVLSEVSKGTEFMVILPF
jgi:signal transduction histidine kinase